MLYRDKIQSAVTLCNSLTFVLLFDRVRVAASLGSIDQLFCQTLCNRLYVPETSLSGTDGEKSNRLVHSPQRRNVDSLATNGSSGADSSGIFSWATVDNGIHDNLDRVGVSEEMNDFAGVLDNSHGHELLAVVSAVHHHAVGQALNDRALRLPESL